MKTLRRLALAAVLAGCVWLGGDRATGFSYFSYGGLSVIWYGNQADRYLSTITFTDGDDPDLLYRAAMGMWSSVWGASFQYRYGYVDEYDTILDPYDGYSITVAVPANQLDPGVLGVTSMVSIGDEWYDMDMWFADVPLGVGWNMLADPDCTIAANPEDPENGFSFYPVAIHELGHALGLGHDPIGDEPAGSLWRIGIMNPAYPAGGPVGNQNIIELHTDERRAMRFLYPGDSITKVDLANPGYSAKGPRLGKAVPSFMTPNPITPGQQLTLWAMTENFGTVPVQNVRQKFFLSTDTLINASDISLGSLTFNVTLDMRNEFAAATTLPDLPAGTYYVGSILDDLNQISEVYEDNNQADYCDPLTIAQAVPQFGAFSQQIINCDGPYTGPTPAVAFPINMGPITWSIDNPQPGMTVDPQTGVIHWPEPAKSPFIYEFVLRATNSAGTSTQTLRLGVQQAAPRIAAIANHATKCGTDYVGPTPVLTAPACMAPILGWSLVNGPPGMTINSSSGVVSWPDATPGQGPVNVTVRAINNVGEATESWLLFVASADGDLDGNTIVNAADVSLFSPCIVGPHHAPGAGCVCADFDQDNDVDLYDFSRLTLAFSGAQIRLGACCLGDANCSVATPDYCYSIDGYYQGDGTTCSQVSCNGACCFYTGGCLTFSLDFCDIAGGTFQGMGTTCPQLSCPAQGNGACCLPNETCIVTTPTNCATSSGAFKGIGMSCGATDCTAPIGACCQVDGNCTPSTATGCSLTGGTFMGDDTTCSANLCDGACCYPTGACLDLSADYCAISAGDFEGPLTDCASFNCPVLPIGACCHTDDTCTEETAERCAGFAGSYQGDNTNCATAACDVRGACCEPDESCEVLTPVACGLQTGTYLGEGTSCSGLDCSLDVVGSCYDTTDWTCRTTGIGICEALGGTFEGGGTTCATTHAPEYSNTTANPTTFYSPAGNREMGDDITLSGTARGLTYYDLAVVGAGGAPFTVNTWLYTECPGAGGTFIPGTQQTWTNVPADGFIYILSADFSANPIRLPGSVWMIVKVSSLNAGWVLAGPAETGSTQDLYGERSPNWECDYWFGGPPNDYAGFWADIQCIELPEPTGACCHANGSCTTGTIPECTAASGTFMGEGVTCASANCSSITVGACCNTTTWSCTSQTASACAAANGSFDGLGTSCSGACPEYRNEINPVTLSYNPGKPMADDLTLTGTARDLSVFSIAVYGGGGGTFSVSSAFFDKSPCEGGVQIPGTLVSGTNLPDGQMLDLRVTLPTPVHLPNNPWLVVEFSNAYAGWIVAETAEAGSTGNVFGLATPSGQSFAWTCNNTISGSHAGFWTDLQCINAGAGIIAATPGEPIVEVLPHAGAAGPVRLAFPPDGAPQEAVQLLPPLSVVTMHRRAGATQNDAAPRLIRANRAQR